MLKIMKKLSVLLSTWICVFDDTKVVLLLHVLDPFSSLTLRINDEGPTSTIGNYNAIVNRKLKEM